MVLGDSGVGKSSIIHRLVTGQFDENLGVSTSIDMKKARIDIENNSIILQLWDTTGNETFKSIIRSVYLETSIVFLVFDVSKANSLGKLDFWLREARNTLQEDCVYVLIANKIDLSNAVSKEQGLEFMARNNLDMYYEISTKTGKNFDDTFKKIVMKFAKETMDARKLKESLRLQNQSTGDVNQRVGGYSYCSV